MVFLIGPMVIGKHKPQMWIFRKRTGRLARWITGGCEISSPPSGQPADLTHPIVHISIRQDVIKQID